MAAAVTGRQDSLFGEALTAQLPALRQAVTGRTVLVTGAAGFIATQTLRELLPLEPATVVLLDMDENRLAELVRTLRTEDLVAPGTRIEPRLTDITTPLVDRLLDDLGEVHTCLQFAAAKHVRTERDVVSTLRMLQVNLNGTLNVTRGLLARNPLADVFVVSTDKAADPSNLMGASKRLMEMAVLGVNPSVRAARFANVAFSTGSLLESWLIRLRSGQPLAVPADTWRYFVSPREAGQLCAVALTAPPGSIVVPDEDATGLVELTAALQRVLLAAGLVTGDGTDGYPVLVTPRDTAGEKQAEEFVGTGEQRQPWLPRLGVVRPRAGLEAALALADWVDDRVADPTMAVTLPDIVGQVSGAVAEFAHIGSDKRLDDRV